MTTVLSENFIFSNKQLFSLVKNSVLNRIAILETAFIFFS